MEGEKSEVISFILYSRSTTVFILQGIKRQTTAASTATTAAELGKVNIMKPVGPMYTKSQCFYKAHTPGLDL